MVKSLNVMISRFDNNNDNNKFKGNKKKSTMHLNSPPIITTPQQQTYVASASNGTVTCLSCRSSDQKIVTDTESGEIICGNCGIVISDKIEESGAEWRNFTSLSDQSNSRSRTGMPTSLARHDMGLATIIGRSDRDASGQKIDTPMRYRMDRLRIWNLRTQYRSSTDRSLSRAFTGLDRLKDKLGLSDAVVEKAAYIYRKAQEKMLTRGRTVSGILAAAIYISCRELGTPRTLKDISEGSNVKLKEVSRSYRLLYFELDLKMPLIDPMKCIAKVANKVKLSEKTKRQAAEIMHNITKREISAGKDPMGLAASVLYLASLDNDDEKENITQTDIARAASVTEVTIRNRAKELKDKVCLN
jgi:transcription initiation factor TFIIB